MAFNITTDKQNAKYAKEFETDLEDFMELYKSEINDYIKKNEGKITVSGLENFITGLIDGNQEIDR
jgi:hypothetical protein